MYWIHASRCRCSREVVQGASAFFLNKHPKVLLYWLKAVTDTSTAGWQEGNITPARWLSANAVAAYQHLQKQIDCSNSSPWREKWQPCSQLLVQCHEWVIFIIKFNLLIVFFFLILQSLRLRTLATNPSSRKKKNTTNPALFQLTPVCKAELASF